MSQQAALPLLMGRYAQYANDRGWMGASPSGQDVLPSSLSTLGLGGAYGPAFFGIRPSRATMRDTGVPEAERQVGREARVAAENHARDREFWDSIRSQADPLLRSQSPEARMHAAKALEGAPPSFQGPPGRSAAFQNGVGDWIVRDGPTTHNFGYGDRGRKAAEGFLKGDAAPSSAEPLPADVRARLPSMRRDVPAMGRELESKISALQKELAPPDPRALEREGALTLLKEPRGAGNLPSEGLEPAYLRALREFWSMPKPDKLNSLAGPAGGAGLAAMLHDYYGAGNYGDER